MSRKFKTPAGYAAPLRSRAQIIAWLTDRAERNPRKGYGLFTFNVKLHSLNTDFAHLCRLARESGELAADASPRYLAAVAAVYDEEDNSRRIWEHAEEDARRHVVEDDSNRMLWDDSGTCAEWTFDGRSGGWLVLTEFDGVKFSDALKWTDAAGYFSTPEADGDPAYKFLRRLYRFLVQCDHDFRRPESEVEYQAAFHLFNNVASEVETDRDHAARLAKEAAEETERAHWEARDVMTEAAP